MIEKPKRPKKPDIQERQPPRTLQELISRYDLDNTKIYDFLDGLVDLLNTREETVDTDISNLNSSVTNLSNNKVNKSGDTLTGSLYFNNADIYDAIRKKRTIDGVDYELSVGLGANKSARMELNTGGQTLAYVEARTDGGIYNGKSGKKLVETNEVNFVHLGVNSTTFSFSIGNYTGGYSTYIIYGGWTKHFVYLLTIQPRSNVIGYNQIFNNTGEANISSVTMSNNIVTINFSSTIWGGIHIIGEQAQST